MSKKQVVIGLDLSINSSGFALIDLDGNVTEAGIITPEKYKNYTKDRYPVSTLKKARSAADQLAEIIRASIEKYDVQKIVVEEINTGGGKGIATAKALSFIHGMLFWEFLAEFPVLFEMISCGVWRSKKGVGVVIRKKKGKRSADNDHKLPIVSWVNSRYGTDFTLEDNDICDAIGIALGYMFINKMLDK